MFERPVLKLWWRDIGIGTSIGGVSVTAVVYCQLRIKIGCAGMIALMQIFVPHVMMMFGGVMLCEVVGSIEFCLAPVNVKLFLANAVSNPVKAHVDRFGAFLLDRVIRKTFGGCVISFQGCGRLWVAYFGYTGADGACLLTIVEQTRQFSFRCDRDDLLHNVTHDVHRCIVHGFGVVRLWRLLRVAWLI
jgi:hypothetical protein